MKFTLTIATDDVDEILDFIHARTPDITGALQRTPDPDPAPAPAPVAEPDPEPAKPPKRAHRKLPTVSEMVAAAAIAPEPAPAPAPEAPAPEPAPDMPELDALKAMVTQAVRDAQKGNGAKDILTLLPAFKEATGLKFIADATEKHRAALFSLVKAADLVETV